MQLIIHPASSSCVGIMALGNLLGASYELCHVDLELIHDLPAWRAAAAGVIPESIPPAEARP